MLLFGDKGFHLLLDPCNFLGQFLNVLIYIRLLIGIIIFLRRSVDLFSFVFLFAIAAVSVLRSFGCQLVRLIFLLSSAKLSVNLLHFALSSDNFYSVLLKFGVLNLW